MLGRRVHQDGQLSRSKRTRAIQPVGNVLTRGAMLLRVAAAAWFVNLAASAQACGRQSRKARDLAHV